MMTSALTLDFSAYTPSLMSSLTRDPSPEDSLDDFASTMLPTAESNLFTMPDPTIGLDELSPFSKFIFGGETCVLPTQKLEENVSPMMHLLLKHDPTPTAPYLPQQQEQQYTTIAPTLLFTPPQARLPTSTIVPPTVSLQQLQEDATFDQTSVTDGESVWSGSSGFHSAQESQGQQFGAIQTSKLYGNNNSPAGVHQHLSPFSSYAPSPRPTTAQYAVPSYAPSPVATTPAPIVIPTQPTARALKRKRASDEDDEDYRDSSPEHYPSPPAISHRQRTHHRAQSTYSTQSQSQPAQPAFNFNFVNMNQETLSSCAGQQMQKRKRSKRTSGSTRPSDYECLQAMEAMTRGSSSPPPPYFPSSSSSSSSHSSAPGSGSVYEAKETTSEIHPSKIILKDLPPLPASAKSCPICGHAPTRKSKAASTSLSSNGTRVSRSDLKRHYETHRDKTSSASTSASDGGVCCRLCTPVVRDESVGCGMRVLVLDSVGEKRWREQQIGGMAQGGMGLEKCKVRYVPFARMDCAQRHWTNVHERSFGAYVNEEHFVKAVLKEEDARLVDEMHQKRSSAGRR